jgi:hypothetical protein
MQRAAGRAPASPVVPGLGVRVFLPRSPPAPREYHSGCAAQNVCTSCSWPIAPRKARKPKEAADTMGLPGVKDGANGTSACAGRHPRRWPKRSSGWVGGAVLQHGGAPFDRSGADDPDVDRRLGAIVLMAGSGLAIMNNACKSNHHAWCAQMSDIRHHVKTGHS